MTGGPEGSFSFIAFDGAMIPGFAKNQDDE
jgi:hypothetical protein